MIIYLQRATSSDLQSSILQSWFKVFEVPLEVSENTEVPLKINVHIFAVTEDRGEAIKNLDGVN